MTQQTRETVYIIVAAIVMFILISVATAVAGGQRDKCEIYLLDAKNELRQANAGAMFVTTRVRHQRRALNSVVDYLACID